jgi:DNA invertase Pin-like site-specific DNA recombinase
MSVKTMKIAIYIRVSTNMQVKENLSLEDQLNTLTKWAKDNNHLVVNVYEDAGSSAYKGVRKQFSQMLHDIENEVIDVDCVAVYDSSRFSRKEVDRLNAEEILHKHNVKFFSFIDCIPDDEDDAFLFKGFNGLFNESFSRKNSKKSAFKLNDAAKQGYFTGGKPPFGYRSVPVPNLNGGKQRKTLEIHPDNASTVELIYSLAISGTSGCSLGVKKIASYLNEQNIFKNNHRWTPNDVHNVLTNPTYFGEREYGLKRIRKDLHNEIIIVPTPEIISKQDFMLVKELMSKRAPKKENKESKGIQSPSLLTGLLKCATCGCNLVINTGKGGQYSYYKCRNKIKHTTKSCNTPNFRKEQLEKSVIKSLRGTIFDASYISSIYDDLKDTLTQRKKEQSLEKATLQRKWNVAEQQVSKLIGEIADNKLTMSAMIQRHLKIYEDNLATIERSIEMLDKKTRLPLMHFGKHHIEQFLFACEKVLLGGNVEATKALLLATVKEIKVYEDKIDFIGGNLQILANVESNKAGNPNGVPSLISIWR